MLKKSNWYTILKSTGFIALGIVLILGLVACSQQVAPAAAPAEEEAAAPVEEEAAAPAEEEVMEEKEYTIVQWDVDLSPLDMPKEENGLTAYQNIAAEYEEMHPNVKIEWYEFTMGGSQTVPQWLQARMTGRDAPDIWWLNTEDLWVHVNKGWALDMTDYMNMPNPYVEGNKKWVDTFQDVAVYSQTGPDGKIYGVNADGAGVLTIYNKDAFKAAGIESEPKTWGEFMDAWQKLLDAGYIPYGADFVTDHCCFPHWTEAHIYNQLIWDKIYEYDDDGNNVITSKELVTHSQMGDFPDWDAYLKLAHMLKDMTPYFPAGYEGSVDYRDLFRQGKVGMYMEGNWELANLKDNPLPFDYGWLAYPVLTKDVWPDAPEKVVRIQGAWGSMQYHVSGYLAETEPDKVPVIMDWLMFVSKPENVTRILKVSGKVPLTKGAEGMHELAPFYEPYDRAVPYQSWQTLSTSAYETEYTLWQTYLPSDMSDEEFLELAKELWQEEVDKVLEQNPDWKIE